MPREKLGTIKGFNMKPSLPAFHTRKGNPPSLSFFVLTKETFTL